VADPPKPRPAQAPASPPRLTRVPEPGQAPKASRGLEAPEVTADAAFAVGLPKEGDLDAEGALRLFALAASTGASGRLTIAPGDSAFSLTFRKGVLEHVRTSHPEDDLPGFLVVRGAVRPEQVAEAAGLAGAGGDLVGALVTRQLVNGADLVRFIQEHAAQLVTRALSVERGGWRWEPGVAPPPSAFPLGSPWVMLGAAVRALDAVGVVRRLGPREQLGATSIIGRVRVEDLRLGSVEARVAGAFDGSRLSDVARLRGTDATTVLRVALLLAEVGLLSFGPPRAGAASAGPHAPAPAAPTPSTAPPSSTPPSADPTARPSANPSPHAPAASAAPPPPSPRQPDAAPRTPLPTTPRPPGVAPRTPLPTTPRPPGVAPRTPPPTMPRPPTVTPPPRAAPVLDERALKALLDSYASADHFKVLGVGPDATPAAIKVAYFQLAKVYHPDTVAVGMSPAVKKLCADVFSRIGEAWGILGDDARRAQYVEDLVTGAGVSVDVMGILQAENVFQTGTLLVKARQYEEAAARFAEALKLNPDEPEYSMWLAWCEFVAAPEKKKVHARAGGAIETALKKSPRCVVGYLFLGQMAKIVGDLGLAEKQLKRGLAVAPDHLELQRELKYLRK
jgi:DnaJ domain/Tetratricopeptide repeat